MRKFLTLLAAGLALSMGIAHGLTIQSASDTGTVTSTRLIGPYTSVTQVGTLATLNVTGAVKANSFAGDGSLLTSIPAGTPANGTVTNAKLATGNFGAISQVGTLASLNVTGAVKANSFAGDGSLLTSIPAGTPANGTVTNAKLATGNFGAISQVGTLASLNVTGAVKANSFAGDGSLLTSIPAGTPANGTVTNAKLATGNFGAISQVGTLATLNVTGAVKANSFAGDGSLLTSIPAGTPANGTVTNAKLATGNFGAISQVGTLATLNVTGAVKANSFAGDGSLLTSIPAGTPANGTVTNAKLVTGNFGAISQVGTLATLNVTGAVKANSFAGDGSLLTSIPAGAPANGTVTNAKLATGNFGAISKVGNLATLNVTSELKVGVLTLVGSNGLYDWTNANDTAIVGINYKGYQGGTTYFRDFGVYDGKSASLLFVDGSAKRFGFNSTAPDKTMEINSASGANLRLTYNDANGSAVNYTDFAVATNGGLKITPSSGEVYIEGSLTDKGLLWTASAATEANSWTSVTYGNGLFVAIAKTGTNRVMTSPDGITWNVRAATEANSWDSVTYGNGLFVAIAKSGTNRVMTSPDGITWTAGTAAEANTWDSLTYGNGLFVAVASNGSNRVMTSPDGITWTASAATEASSWSSVTYGNGLFVAVSSNGTNRVMTSPDGITWTARAATEASYWSSVTYGNGLFVAVASNGTNRVMTSPEGITWTVRAATEASSWSSVTYGNGLFVAVSSDGTNRVMTSPEGITWTARTAAEANGWYSVTYGNGLFVAIANSGTNRVMKSGYALENINPKNNQYNGITKFTSSVGIGTANSPQRTLSVVGDLQVTGNIYETNFAMGEMYASYNATAMKIALTEVYYIVTANVVSGSLDDFTFTNSGADCYLTCGVAGLYLFNGSISFSGGNNDEFHGGVSINNRQPEGKLEFTRLMNSTGDKGSASFSGAYRLAVNDVIRVKMENETDADDPTVTHMNLTVIRIAP